MRANFWNTLNSNYFFYWHIFCHQMSPYGGYACEIHFAIDFDGTVTFEDTTRLLDRLADPVWLIAEEDWLAGRIGSRECLARQAALLHATPAQIDAALADVRMDPDFAAFVHMARMTEATMEILRMVSIAASSACAGAHGRPDPCHLQSPSPCRQRWMGRRISCIRVGLPRTPAAYANAARPSTERMLVLIGDGRSDFCLASRADFVLAKASLAAYCTQYNLPFKPIGGFADVLEWLQRSPAELPCEAAFRP